MNPIFSDDWKIWIWHNVERGCSKDGIFKILIDKGFDYQDIRNELDFEPSAPLDEIENLLENTEKNGDNETQLGNLQYSISSEYTSKHPTDKAEIYIVENFLNKSQCKQLISAIRRNLKPSLLTNQDEPDKYFRTSKTCDLSIAQKKNSLIHKLDNKICKFVGVNSGMGERIQGQYYEVGEEFKAHTDFFEGDDVKTLGGNTGQRTLTGMIYLNTVEEGGGTKFVNLDHIFTAKAGKMILWNNLYPDQTPNHDTIHHGLPVIKGYKAIITKWFRLNDPNELR